MNKIELFENERATDYNQFVQTWIPNYHHFLDHLPQLLRQTKIKELLAVGCGTGNEIERFVNTAEQWNITGIDPSYSMVQQAKEKFRKYNNINIIHGLVSDLPITKKYHVATLLLVLHFFEDNGDKLNLLKDIADRLSPKAPFVLLDISGNPQQISQNLHILELLLPDTVNPEQISQRLARIQNELYAISEERFSELLQEAGFEKPLRFFQSSIYMGWISKKK